MISVKMSSNALTSAAQSPVIRATASSLVSLRWSARRSRTSLSGQFGLAPARKRGDRLDVRGPARVVRRERGLVARLRGLDEIDRDHDVFLEQLGQPIAGGLPVEAGDRGADVLLVGEQSLAAASRIRRPGDGGDDVFARPDDVVGPQLAERQPDRFP